MDRPRYKVTPPVQRWAAHGSDFMFDALAGASSGIASSIMTCPLDVVKTKLQAQRGGSPSSEGIHVGQPRVYSGLIGTTRVIWREEGLRGMYRGLGITMLGYLPNWAIYFGVYNKCKSWMAHHQVQNHLAITTASAIVAGATGNAILCPIWVVKTRIMSQSSGGSGQNRRGGPRPSLSPHSNYTSAFDAFRKMYTTEGILSFYTGLTPALFGVTHVAVQFPAYEYLRKKFTGQGMGETQDGGRTKQRTGILAATILSKCLATVVTYPHEVIRTRLQTQRRLTPGTGAATTGIRDRPVIRMFSRIAREGGWRAFYVGLGVTLMRSVPNSVVTFMTYEEIMMYLNHARSEGLRKRDSEDLGFN
ncbi:mitochondrial carrier domain-containing protein [Xylariaceae sp. FL0804]|nr:mitochondrial carrier domain-containing protein [Xylariaceae sp. FL0804]